MFKDRLIDEFKTYFKQFSVINIQPNLKLAVDNKNYTDKR